MSLYLYYTCYIERQTPNFFGILGVFYTEMLDSHDKRYKFRIFSLVNHSYIKVVTTLDYILHNAYNYKLYDHFIKQDHRRICCFLAITLFNCVIL